MIKEFEKNEKLLLFGRWTSKIGNIIFDYANSVTIVNLSNVSSILLAIYQSSEVLISIIFNLIGGVISDGNNKKRIIIVTDIFSGFVCCFLSLFLKSKKFALILILTNIMLAIINAFNSPTYKSIVRELITKDRIGHFNSISNGGIEVVKVIAPIMGLLLVEKIGIRGALLFDAITFFVSATSEMMLVSLKQDIGKRKKEKMLRKLAEGFRYLYTEKNIFYLIVLSAIVNFFMAGFNLLVPYTNVMYNGIFEEFYSKVMVAEAIGGILGSVICANMRSNISENVIIIKFFLFIVGIFIVLIPIMKYTSSMVLSLFPFLGCSVAMTIFNIQFISFIQYSVNENYAGRVFSIIFTVAALFMPIGSFAFSFFTLSSEIKSFFIIGIGIILIALFNFIFIQNKFVSDFIRKDI